MSNIRSLNVSTNNHERKWFVVDVYRHNKMNLYFVSRHSVNRLERVLWNCNKAVCVFKDNTLQVSYYSVS